MDDVDGTVVAERTAGNTAIRALVGDLTTQDVEVVVNAANEHLSHGGGVAAALARAGGSVVQHESDAWVAKHGLVQQGTAAITSAGAMPASHIVHVVGPRYLEGRDNEALLRQAVGAALDAAERLGARSIALPAISAGIFGYPPQEAGAVIADACRQWAAAGGRGIEEIRLVGIDDQAAQHFARGLDSPGPGP